MTLCWKMDWIPCEPSTGKWIEIVRKRCSKLRSRRTHCWKFPRWSRLRVEYFPEDTKVVSNRSICLSFFRLFRKTGLMQKTVAEFFDVPRGTEYGSLERRKREQTFRLPGKGRRREQTSQNTRLNMIGETIPP